MKKILANTLIALVMNQTAWATAALQGDSAVYCESDYGEGSVGALRKKFIFKDPSFKVGDLEFKKPFSVSAPSIAAVSDRENRHEDIKAGLFVLCVTITQN